MIKELKVKDAVGISVSQKQLKYNEDTWGYLKLTISNVGLIDNLI